MPTSENEAWTSCTSVCAAANDSAAAALLSMPARAEPGAVYYDQSAIRPFTAAAVRSMSGSDTTDARQLVLVLKQQQLLAVAAAAAEHTVCRTEQAACQMCLREYTNHHTHPRGAS